MENTLLSIYFSLSLVIFLKMHKMRFSARK